MVGITNNVIQFSAPSHGAFLRSSPSPVYLTVATLMEKILGPLSAFAFLRCFVGFNPSCAGRFYTRLAVLMAAKRIPATS